MEEKQMMTNNQLEAEIQSLSGKVPISLWVFLTWIIPSFFVTGFGFKKAPDNGKNDFNQQ